MEKADKINPSSEGLPGNARRLTILVIGSVGKVRSFKIFPSVIYAAIVFLVIYIPLTIYVTNKFFSLRDSNRILSKEIERLERELVRDKRALQKTYQRVAILEDYINNLEAREKEGKKPEPARILEGAGAAGTKTVEKTISDLVDIKDMVIQKEGFRMTVNFRVVNLKEGENPVGGYVHIMAKSKDGTFPKEWTFPREDLQNGIPLSFRRGQLFLIQRFKPIRGIIDLNAEDEPPTAIKVMVYGQSGELLLEREYEVDNGS
ncbi:MAG: hypothetical protein JRJ03_06335 [Deltaproteobacteria bacterium]|nr:hypothetical protein [Deltaproteobacteria bacterium]